MKPVVGLIGIAVAGVAGYLLEPSVRPSLISVQQPAAPEEPRSEDPEPAAEPPPPAPQPPVEPPSAAPPAWVAALKPDQFPGKVTLKRSVEFSAPGAAQALVMEAGTQATPVRIEGNDLVVTLVPGGPIEGRVPVMETDLVALLGNQPPAVEPPAPEPPAPDPVEPPVAGGEPMEEPAEEPAPEPAASLDAEEIVKLMQDSIKAGSVSEFTFDQVLGWKAGEDEERDGVTYQTGLVAYKAETIFGVKTIQAQALIDGGKIVRWIWPKSGMEIK
ncbi:hypothetical protein [Haloferula sp. A504]|uniref:hypothetical protein n=1 Tax=Haloferula sp. A504 TaxID=3373601 RepID=UPI0031BCCEE0|nr:hypothetical protein [Verrucomicrobiaceae bacterium E54]